MFSVTVKLPSGTNKLTWNNGKLSGSPLLVAVAESWIKAHEGHPVGPYCGPFTTEDHLESDMSSAMLIEELLRDAPHEWSGDVPRLEPVPEGAVP